MGYMEEEKKKRLIIIDSNAVIHRAFHALPPLTTKKGEIVNAVYGFLLIFLKTIKEFNPDFIVATFDFPAPTFRHKKYRLYKANREKAPQELYDQIPKVKEVLKVFKIKILEKKGFEADDLIGTVAKLAKRKQIFPPMETIILTGDMDALQLVDNNTKVYAPKRGVKDAILYEREEVKEKMGGLNPEQVVDYKALRGDPSDNIPGIDGIGDKTAISLLLKYKSLENLYEELRENTKKVKEMNQNLKEKLLIQKDQALVSQMLAQINKDVPIELDFKDCLWKKYDREEVVRMFEDYGFKTLINRLPEESLKSNLSLW